MEKQNEELYIYAVHPKKVIVIDGVGAIRSPKSLYLSKEDVLTCLKKASVYRRFPFGISERVNIDNADRLHREKYMTEDEYNEYIKSEKSADHGYVAVSSTEKSEDKNVQESSPINNNESNAEVDTEKQTDAKSEIVDESTPSQEDQENASAQDNVMDDTKEVKENNENQKSQQTNEQYVSKHNNNNYNRKNNKK